MATPNTSIDRVNGLGSKKCYFKDCSKIDHTECFMMYKQQESKRVSKYYHEKYKNECFLCECGLKISRTNKRHLLTDKHKNLLLLKEATKTNNNNDNLRTS